MTREKRPAGRSAPPEADATDPDRSESALRESEARYRDLFENANDAIFVLDANHRYVDVNRRATELFGYSREEFLALGVFDLIPPEQAQQSRATFQVLLEQGRYDKFTGRMRAKDGRWLDIEASSSAIVRDGKFAGSRDIVRDVTAGRQVRERLQHSQDLLNRAEAIAGLGCWEWDVASNTLTWSDEVFRIYGLDPARTVPTYQLVVDTVHPAFRAEFLQAIEAALTGDQPFEGQYALVQPDGSVRFTHTKGELVRDASGNPVRMVGVVQDISERKRSETFIQDILETVDEGFLIIDRDYRILSANRAYAEQAGLALKEILGRKCHVVSHGLGIPCHATGEDCPVRRVFATGEPAVALHTHQDTAGNPIYVETKAFPMTDPTGQVSAAIEIVNNVTEKRRLEEQYRQAQKMEAVALLAGGVAHDFNNLLTAITGYGHMLSMRMGPADPSRDFVEQILGAADRAATLTQSLMAFGRKQIVNPVPMDLSEVVAGILKLLRRVIGEDVELVTSFAREGTTVLADPSQIEQVLMNLATNARDAMPGGGTLTIVTERVVVDEAFRRDHGFGEDGPWACLRVSDTGMGMDERTRERIFEPFFTTKELGRGTGLGLASVYGIVKQSRGYITVASEPGRGTSFSILLPLVRQEGGRSGPAEPPLPATGSETILLAEDDPVLLRLLRSVLTAHGYTVIEAENGEKAIERFSENRGRVDLLVLDLVMPKKNGKDAHAVIASLQPGVETLFISGYSSAVLDPAVLQGRGCHYLPKPLAPPVFLNKVRQILDARALAERP
jgi:PAS domain S-box-containing protein